MPPSTSSLGEYLDGLANGQDPSAQTQAQTQAQSEAREEALVCFSMALTTPHSKPRDALAKPSEAPGGQSAGGHGSQTAAGKLVMARLIGGLKSLDAKIVERIPEAAWVSKAAGGGF